MRDKGYYILFLIADVVIIFLCVNFILNKYNQYKQTKPITETKTETKPQIRNILFRYISSPSTSKVEIIGDFNDWTPELLERKTEKIWEMVKKLKPGKYAYNYIVNGKVVTDPYQKRVTDTGRGFLSSLLIVKPIE